MIPPYQRLPPRLEGGGTSHLATPANPRSPKKNDPIIRTALLDMRLRITVLATRVSAAGIAPP